MLESARILICEDEPFIALDLAATVEDAGGVVVGPAASFAEGMALLETFEIDGAILDVHLMERDSTPIAELLLARNIPVVFQTGLELPAEFTRRWPAIQAFKKPSQPELLVTKLATELRRNLRSL